MAKQCELIIGYLLPRQCEEKAINLCTNCGRGMCELHTSMGDHGLLCRDCFEEGKPRDAGEPEPLAEPVQEIIYSRGYQHFDDDGDDAFQTLS